MKNVLPFMQSVQNAVRRLEDAKQRDHIEYVRIEEGGILRGYFLAGAVCKVEYEAAVHQLQDLYEEKLQIKAPKLHVIQPEETTWINTFN